MKAIVFGATGFIGSHVTEQLVRSGHDVTAVVRSTSETVFFKSLGVPLVHPDFSDINELAKIIGPHTVVYNCIAHRGSVGSIEQFREIEVELTRKIANAAARANARRYLQLSSIIVYGMYGTHLPKKPIDESFSYHPETIMNQAACEREQVVGEVAAVTGLDTVILQPASTIGQRDKRAFFYRMLTAHLQNKFPLVGGGTARFSCVDTRDIGRAMVWLGQQNETVKGQTYLLKGYDISFLELKQGLDRVRGVNAGAQKLPKSLALLIARVMELLLSSPPLTRGMVLALTTNRIYNDQKIRKAGFQPQYTNLEETLTAAIS